MKNISSALKEDTLPISDSTDITVSKELDTECRIKKKQSLKDNEIYDESREDEITDMTNYRPKSKELFLHDREEDTELYEGKHAKLKTNKGVFNNK